MSKNEVKIFLRNALQIPNDMSEKEFTSEIVICKKREGDYIR
nr:hypothetical protein [Bacillus sp. 491mf]